MNLTPVLVLGSLPAWLNLGPVVDRGGVPARQVLGDWSHIQECDQPPAYVLDGWTAPRTPAVRLDAAEPLPQRLPGKNIAELRGLHSGKVAILFNGGTLADHDLFRIKVPIIGMNRTHLGHSGYAGPQPDYLCVIDVVWTTNHAVLEHPRLINGSVSPKDHGYRASRHFRASPFSFDLAHDGYVPAVPGTTGFLALQAAVYLGFTDLYCVGLDLGGAHFDGSKGSQHFDHMNRHFNRMATVLKARGINVWICGSPKSRCTAFPHAPFEALVA